MQLSKFTRPRRGSALSLAIVVSVVITSLVAALAWVAGSHAQSTGAILKMDQAFFAAESGAQRIAWFARNRNIGTLTSPITGSVNGYNYTVSWPRGTVNGAQITSTATAATGIGSYTLSFFCSPSYAAAPAFSSWGSFDNKNTLITGDVATNGNFTSSGSAQLSGDVYYGGIAAGLSNVSGIIYPSSPFPAVDFAALDITLRATSLKLSNLLTSYDFNLAPGTNKVIYVVGDVTDPTFPPNTTGTLYVKGKVHFTKPNVVVGSANYPVNIVATNDITFDQTIKNYYGGIYTAKNINRAQLDITGSVYAGGTIGPSNFGTSHFIVGALPWFDYRPTTGAVTSLTFTTFTGPLP